MKNISEKEDESEGMNSDDIKMIDKKMRRIYNLSVALLVIGLVLLLGFFYVSLFLIPIGLYGIIKYKLKPDELREFLVNRMKKMEEKNKGKIQGGVILLIGTIVLVMFITLTIRIFQSHPNDFAMIFEGSFFPYVDASIIGIALTLTGIFTIRPMQSRNGKTILGISTMVFGVIIIIIPLFHISIWWNASPSALVGAFVTSSFFWLVGIIFFIYGISLVIKVTSKKRTYQMVILVCVCLGIWYFQSLAWGG